MSLINNNFGDFALPEKFGPITAEDLKQLTKSKDQLALEREGPGGPAAPSSIDPHRRPDMGSIIAARAELKAKEREAKPRKPNEVLFQVFQNVAAHLSVGDTKRRNDDLHKRIANDEERGGIGLNASIDSIWARLRERRADQRPGEIS